MQLPSSESRRPEELLTDDIDSADNDVREVPRESSSSPSPADQQQSQGWKLLTTPGSWCSLPAERRRWPSVQIGKVLRGGSSLLHTGYLQPEDPHREALHPEDLQPNTARAGETMMSAAPTAEATTTTGTDQPVRLRCQEVNFNIIPFHRPPKNSLLSFTFLNC